ncbi:hypothetical protein [Salinisphaera aquimarina]|uniref:Lipoprotein n=1 Tax=Salinisphaera aquimarina TaxID=2094031 RepID=A0ABV7EQ71_9GAMM
MRALLCCGLVIVLAGCASHPRDQRQAAYEAYWNCAFAEARPYIDDHQVSPSAAAMRAQAQCNDSYAQYRTVNSDYVRSVVRPDGYEMATRLADQSALQKRRDLTQRLTTWVAQARR